MKLLKTKIKDLMAAGGLLAAFTGGSLPAQILTSESFAIGSGAGGSGGGTSSSCMIMSDGTSWSGGAVGVQGAASTKVGGGNPLAANVTFKYSVGAAVDSLNSTYGAGNWTIANPTLSFQYTLYANNTRFGGGAGGLSIYWVGNDSWIQGTSNPAFVTTEADLTTWAGSQALLGSEYYDWSTPNYTGTTADLTTGLWVTDKTGDRQSTISYGLALDSSFLSDITSATASTAPDVSLYLMATSDTLGLCIFTGGASVLPTLSFDVVAVPEPSAFGMVFCGLVGLVTLRRWKN